MFKEFRESLSDFLKIQGVNVLARDEFLGAAEYQKEKFIHLMLEQCNFDLIVKFACTTSDFYNACRSPVFNEHWMKLWSTYGILITKDPSKALYYQRCSNKFDLFLGIYFYYRALRVKDTFNKNTSTLEKDYLLKAMDYGSIHACQQYSVYLFNDYQNHPPPKETADSFQHLLACIKKLIPDYGSYAYIMLAETYVRFGMFQFSLGHEMLTDKAFSAANLAAIKAQESYLENDPAIFNASFGQGLAASNSLHLDDLEEIRNYISTITAKGYKDLPSEESNNSNNNKF
ncbi:DUF5630 domain-containing protein [Legionella jamestowniensis]|uniref:Ankyrin repeat protein n=1 Tax=Legionella jamestowniensis TaxID=455 RepID=A0A0W0UGL4_9GAMM|nr:DUF5630 domain-containing protein [Legionella jamestowniensis]KTD06844.1 hypothetical protein Ljam_1039 [Legionella jamestowniensis]SFL82371.1 hypothetical protein SAMN02746073_2072 [Legionella jamestowniensis DSM 19215]